MKTIFFALNKKLKTITILDFKYWLECQNAFRFGIYMSDGNLATGIGRCDVTEFESRATKSGLTVIE